MADQPQIPYGIEVEQIIPGYLVVPPDQVESARGTEPSSPFDDLWPELEAPWMEWAKIAHKAHSSKDRLRRQILGVLRGLDSPERTLVGLPESAFTLDSLSAWQICRLVFYAVFRGAVYDTKRAAFKPASGNIKRTPPPDLDNRSSISLLRDAARGRGKALVCRDYVRLVVDGFLACRNGMPWQQSVHLLALEGRAMRQEQELHAWCLYVDTERRIASPMDPTSADLWWDEGRAESPFNKGLDARHLSSLSALCSRLIFAAHEKAESALTSIAEALPPRQRLALAAQVLSQRYIQIDLPPESFEALVSRLAGLGLPPEVSASIRPGYRQTLQLVAKYPGYRRWSEQDPRRRCFAIFFRKLGVEPPSGLTTNLDREASQSPPAPPTPGKARPGRNDPCPCGSGKKFKKCCGKAGG